MQQAPTQKSLVGPAFLVAGFCIALGIIPGFNDRPPSEDQSDPTVNQIHFASPAAAQVAGKCVKYTDLAAKLGEPFLDTRGSGTDTVIYECDDNKSIVVSFAIDEQTITGTKIVSSKDALGGLQAK